MHKFVCYASGYVSFWWLLLFWSFLGDFHSLKKGQKVNGVAQHCTFRAPLVASWHRCIMHTDDRFSGRRMKQCRRQLYAMRCCWLVCAAENSWLWIILQMHSCFKIVCAFGFWLGEWPFVCVAILIIFYLLAMIQYLLIDIVYSRKN